MLSNNENLILENDKNQVDNTRKCFYENIWKSTDGNDYVKSLTLFSVYCYNGEHISTRSGAAAISTVLERYYSNCNYILENRNTLICTTAFLLFQIVRNLEFNIDNFDFSGELAAVFNVIYNYTNVDVRRYLRLKSNSIHKSEYINRGILTYSDDFLHEFLKNYNTWMGMLMSTFFVSGSFEDLVSLKMINGNDLVKSFDEGNNKRCFSDYNFFEVLIRYDDDISINYGDIVEVINKPTASSYVVRMYLFCKLLNQNIPGVMEKILRELKEILYLENKISEPLINGHIIYPHEFSIYKRYRDINDNHFESGRPSNEETLLFYLKLLESKEFILNWEFIEQLIFEYFKPDLSQLLIVAVKFASPPEVIDYLIKVRKINGESLVSLVKYAKKIKPYLRKEISSDTYGVNPFRVILDFAKHAIDFNSEYEKDIESSKRRASEFHGYIKYSNYLEMVKLIICNYKTFSINENELISCVDDLRYSGIHMPDVRHMVYMNHKVFTFFGGSKDLSSPLSLLPKDVHMEIVMKSDDIKKLSS